MFAKMHQTHHPQQMMQQQGAPLPSPLKAVTTEEIQRCLEENKNLILAILENQNQGKFTECAQYQVILQKNLTYLAAVADAQPPPSTPSQPQASAAHPATAIQQQGQQGVSGPRLPFQLNAHPSQDHHFQLMQFQQQQLQGHINLGPGGANGMHRMVHPSGEIKGTNKQAFDGGSGNIQGKSALEGGD